MNSETPCQSLLSSSHSPSSESTETLPSPNLLLQLSTLVPNPPYAPPPAPTVLLAPLLQYLNNTNVRSYLLTPDPLHITPLSSPSLFTSSFTFNLNITRASAFTLPPTTSPVSHLENELLFCPAFNYSNLTIGTGVMRVITRTAPFLVLHEDPQTVQQYMNFRFLTDTDNLFFLMVYNIPDNNSILLFYSHVLDTRTSRGVSLVFHRQRFLEILVQHPTNLSIPHLLSNLRMFQEEFEHHVCAICNDQSVVTCSCQYTIKRGAHPMDTRQFVNALGPHLGSFQCVLNQVVFDQGRGVKHELLGSNIFFEGVIDNDLVRRLADWSLSDFVKTVAEDPQRSLRLPASSDVDLTSVPGDALVPICAKTGAPCWNHANDRSRSVGVEITEVDLDAEGSTDRSERGAENVCEERGVSEKLLARRKLLSDRRERNRASAQRSNLRRKMLLQNLEVEITKCKEKVSELREKEMILRKENLELRKSVT
eukprot:GFKZ01007545.1.p1 GENE.GFKZ01007545.1~~GFKZ01007545.1.p1  ORF type:complete len:480 (+),score=37.27 GFKZ01007545.1:113-1552(+)